MPPPNKEGNGNMAIIIKETPIEGVFSIQPHMYRDQRGLYEKHYEAWAYREAGLNVEFTESSDLYSVKGAVRGLHYQSRYSQAKLVRVIYGAVYDVALDLRPHSKTFGKHYAALLKADDHKALYIPEGFAHGFISLTDETIFSYQCSGKYAPEYCGGILWNDPELGICWPLGEYGIDNVICTEKDRGWPNFREYCRGVNIV